MFEYISSTFNSIIQNDVKDKFQSVKKKLETINCQKIESLYSKLGISSFRFDKEIVALKSSVYSFDYHNLVTSHICDVFENDNSIAINLESDKLIFDLPSIYSIKEFIKVTQNRYIFMPVLYGSIGNAKVNHMATMVLILESKEVFLLEPNNRPTYFNKFNEYDLSYHIETFFSDYFKRLDFSYIYIDTWNSGNHILNGSSFKNYEIDSGHCVVLSIMLSHFMTITDSPPSEVYTVFSSLNNEETAYIIREYSCGIYKLMTA